MAAEPEDEKNSEHDLIQAGYRFALSLTHHREEAEDIVQQSCFRVIAKKGRLHSRSYLFKTIRNLFYDISRRKKLVPFEPIDEAAAVSSKQTEIGLHMDLESELNKLGSEEREVLFLNCVEGYTAAELASMLGKPRSTVLNILSRAKAKLKKSNQPTAEQQSG